MMLEAQIFGVLVSILTMLAVTIISIDRGQIGRVSKRQKIIVFMLLEIARKDAVLRDRLAPEIAKLIEMNGD